MLWDLTNRSPLRLGRDIIAAFARPATLVHGLATFALGGALVTLGTMFLFPLVRRSHELLVLETWTLLAALSVDLLIGPELRRRR